MIDAITGVMSKNATDPESSEVASLASLPSRAQPVEVRYTQGGGTACFVACSNDANIMYSTGKIRFGDVRKKLCFRFQTLELKEACIANIEQCISNTKTPWGQPNPDSLDVMNAVIDMLESHPPVIAYQVAHPLDELGFMTRLFDMIHKVDGCGGLSGGHDGRYTIPCMCGHDECNKDVWYKDGTKPTSCFGLMHQNCALRYMNIRSVKSGYMIFDYPALNIEGELVNSDTGRLFFVTNSNASCPSQSNPTSYAQLNPLLHGTTIATALVELSTEQREVLATRDHQYYHENAVSVREYQNVRNREAAAVRRELSWQHYVATTGDTTSMSAEQLKQRYQDVDQAMAKFKEKYGHYPFIQVCDAKEVEKGGQMVINRNEDTAFTQRPGAPFKKDDGDNFSRSQLGPFGSGADIEIEIGHKWELPSGRVSRDNETALILYCKKKYPGNTLNQQKVGPNTDIMAKRNNWDNRRRVNVLMLIDLLPALEKGSAKLNPDPVRHMTDVQRLKNYHPSRFFL